MRNLSYRKVNLPIGYDISKHKSENNNHKDDLEILKSLVSGPNSESKKEMNRKTENRSLDDDVDRKETSPLQNSSPLDLDVEKPDNELFHTIRKETDIVSEPQNYLPEVKRNFNLDNTPFGKMLKSTREHLIHERKILDENIEKIINDSKSHNSSLEEIDNAIQRTNRATYDCILQSEKMEEKERLKLLELKKSLGE